MADSLSSSISALTSAASQPYTATASVGADGASLDSTTSAVTGDRTTGLFSKKSTGMDKDSFLKLLMTQMQYQDPLNPADSTQYVAELAQFSALESSNNIETAVKNLNGSFGSTVDAQKASAQSLTNASAVSLIGKDARLQQTSLTWQGVGAAPVSLRINLGNLSGAQVQIKDADGNIVKTLTTDTKDATNAGTVTWDGVQDNGKTAPSGTYSIAVVGSDTNKDLYAFVQDTVTGVTFVNGNAMVKVGGQQMSVANIMDVSQSAAAAGDAAGVSPISAVGLIGKEVRVRSDAVLYSAQANEDHVINVNLGNATTAQVQILDQLGRVVATRTATAGADGTGTVDWNGATDGGGNYVAAGIYSVKIVGQDINPSLYSFDKGLVNGVGTAGGSLQIRVNGRNVSAADILDIQNPTVGS
ncbi:MAG: flagellar hook capping FlgD N-terminal domain-containing protein [Chitinivibrionales bacterium]|nr:flagellar hook capping FlgD N-terminal domain-containing protein [Chitinivibrionales bacterium]